MSDKKQELEHALYLADLECRRKKEELKMYHDYVDPDNYVSSSYETSSIFMPIIREAVNLIHENPKDFNKELFIDQMTKKIDDLENLSREIAVCEENVNMLKRAIIKRKFYEYVDEQKIPTKKDIKKQNKKKSRRTKARCIKNNSVCINRFLQFEYTIADGSQEESYAWYVSEIKYEEFKELFPDYYIKLEICESCERFPILFGKKECLYCDYIQDDDDYY